ncbi:putative thiol peroxidase [Leptospira fainei serovar Hurstbridge str. BUT 6]|uniref:Thiol peroxidase n=1 Tax=Leptospira fainei serovar Hurstbridge str. BUT 6 TaxID=1193011 RepID=S3VZ37_9LEPT|nr:thiol peroxidase [Leptospira fainei]EPG73352.1 putative thiol peroxidase [Leptospira fainei serovar Hurstbridge str. BUT 6]
MANVTLKGSPVQLEGKLVQVGDKAPDFAGTAKDLSSKSLKDFADKVKILVGVPSLDTSVCALETKKFHERAAKLDGIVTIVISGDLPFAMNRFCTTEGIDSPNLVTLSQFRDFSFSKAFGTHIADGGLKGLSARAVFVLDKNNTVKYAELVPEIASEPNYEAAVAEAKKLI